MGLIEWLIERRNPGPIGSVETEPPPRLQRGGERFAGIIFSLAALGAWIYFLASKAQSSRGLTGALFVTALYLFIAYRYKPEPDLSNTGIFGFIDHPFKYSDDMNRFLIFLRFFLWPGRMVATGLAELFHRSDS
jgi:hypothetical protein